MDPALRDRWTQEALRRVADAGLRSGAARTAVIERLASDGQCLLSAQELHLRMRRDGTGSIASIYRVLDELASLGLLHRLDGRDGTARYEIVDPEHHHHHVIDDATGRPEPFTDPALEVAVEQAAERLGLELTDHEIVLRGRRR